MMCFGTGILGFRSYFYWSEMEQVRWFRDEFGSRSSFEVGFMAIVGYGLVYNMAWLRGFWSE